MPTQDYIVHQIASCDFSTRAKRPFDAIVLDAFNTKGIGHVTKVLVRGGILRVGDVLTAGTTWGKVKRLLNESTGSIVNFAGPSDIVQVMLLILSLLLKRMI